MSFEKIKSFLKEVKEINRLYLKEKTNLAVLFAILCLTLYLLLVNHIFPDSYNSNLSFLIILLGVIISFFLNTIILFQLENYRKKYINSSFNKFLQKIEKFKSFFKTEKLSKAIFFSIFRMLLVLFIIVAFFVLFIISISIQSITFTSITGVLVVFLIIILMILLGDFIEDIVQIRKNN